MSPRTISAGPSTPSRLSVRPDEKLSYTVTLAPAASRSRTKCEPMKPAPPVMKMRAPSRFMGANGSVIEEMAGRLHRAEAGGVIDPRVVLLWTWHEPDESAVRGRLVNRGAGWALGEVREARDCARADPKRRQGHDDHEAAARQANRHSRPGDEHDDG